MNFLLVLHYKVTALKFLLLLLSSGLLVIFNVSLPLHLILLHLNGFAHAYV